MLSRKCLRIIIKTVTGPMFCSSRPRRGLRCWPGWSWTPCRRRRWTPCWTRCWGRCCPGTAGKNYIARIVVKRLILGGICIQSQGTDTHTGYLYILIILCKTCGGATKTLRPQCYSCHIAICICWVGLEVKTTTAHSMHVKKGTAWPSDLGNTAMLSRKCKRVIIKTVTRPIFCSSRPRRRKS